MIQAFSMTEDEHKTLSEKVQSMLVRIMSNNLTYKYDYIIIFDYIIMCNIIHTYVVYKACTKALKISAIILVCISLR